MLQGGGADKEEEEEEDKSNNIDVILSGFNGTRCLDTFPLYLNIFLSMCVLF